MASPLPQEDAAHTQRARRTGRARRLYYLHPWIGLDIGWDEAARAAQELGFSHILLGWPFGSPADLLLTQDLGRIAGEAADERLSALAGTCRELGLELWIDLTIARAAAGGVLAQDQPDLWHRPQASGLDPRSLTNPEATQARFDHAPERERLAAFWAERVMAWQRLGICGVRYHEAGTLPLDISAAILGPARDRGPFEAFGWMDGASPEGFSAAADLFDWISPRTDFVGEDPAGLIEASHTASRNGGAGLIGVVGHPFSARSPARRPGDWIRRAEIACATAALLADGWLMPMGFEYGIESPFQHAAPEDFAVARAGTADLRGSVQGVNAQASALELDPDGQMRPLRLSERVSVVLRQGEVTAPRLLVINRDPVNAFPFAIEAQTARLGLSPARASEVLQLPPASAASVDLRPTQPVLAAEPVPLPQRATVARDRIAIEGVQPVADGGRFPVKRCIGDIVTVTADIFGDGHEVLAAELRWKPRDGEDWSRAPMRPRGNDRWQGSFPLLRVGPHDFSIEAWWDEFGTFRRDFAKKREAGLDLRLEITEGRMLLERFAAGAGPDERAVIEANLARLGASPDEDSALLLSGTLAGAMAKADPRPHATGAERVFTVEADREAAGFSSWYELFPRSITDDPGRHGTFRDVIGRLPAIQAMGFDVLYFPPIHPIGKTNRKGRNNSLVAGPDDPGSPYAIGAAEGGHDAIHPELGSLEDFLALVREAGRHGLEIALDFAIQCSPDHPWLKQHPDWFSWRPDGSMRYAENPPKKYQDIVNVDFYAPGAVPDLWLALRDAVQFWVDQGVRIFRVDNPHTKPFPFWEWLIADIRSRDPGVLFLAEAFTRPKVMYRLGKVGFSQSYTYFTWRNTKAELTEYLTELNAAPAREIYRPHFFVNTPDINPVFLQTSGRPGFLIRAALAATLSGLWGVYSGFELCESAPVPGKEEYLDSEKYEIRPRDWQAPGNIVAEIAKLNAIRRAHPALQSHLGLTFYNASDDNILYFGKRDADADEIILVAVNLDPHNAHSAMIEVPLWEFGGSDDAAVAVEDLMSGDRFTWHGKTQTIHLDPHRTPFSIWRITMPGGTLS